MLNPKVGDIVGFCNYTGEIRDIIGSHHVIYWKDWTINVVTDYSNSCIRNIDLRPEEHLRNFGVHYIGGSFTLYSKLKKNKLNQKLYPKPYKETEDYIYVKS